jgi:L-threonylcarbamoyladenylate synthase
MSIEAYQTQIRSIDGASMAEAKRLLAAGEVVAVPTETVYGLAADATNASAVTAIYGAKGRPSFNPLIVHVERRLSRLEDLHAVGIIDQSLMTPEARSVAQRLMDLFWPGPLTIVLPRGERIVDEATGGLDTVGVRMPSHPGFQALLREVGFPLAAPSANRSKRISPTTAAHVMEELGGRIPLILDGGATTVGVESTILSVETNGTLRLLRPGGIPAEKIAGEMGLVVAAPLDQPSPTILAPGMMLEHYAPGKPLALINREDTISLHKWLMIHSPTDSASPKTVGQGHGAVGVLLFDDQRELPPDWISSLAGRNINILALPSRDGGEAAAKGLFAALRTLDAADAQVIVVENPSFDGGLWPAIRDRLRRASARWSLENTPE